MKCKNTTGPSVEVEILQNKVQMIAYFSYINAKGSVETRILNLKESRIDSGLERFSFDNQDIVDVDGGTYVNTFINLKEGFEGSGFYVGSQHFFINSDAGASVNNEDVGCYKIN